MVKSEKQYIIKTKGVVITSTDKNKTKRPQIKRMLTAMEEEFCLLVSKGALQKDAFMVAYKKTAEHSENYIKRQSSVILKRPMVLARIKELRDQNAKTVKWDKEKAIKGLIKLWEVAFAQLENSRLNVANVRALEKATKELNKMLDLDPEIQLRKEELAMKKELIKRQGLGEESDDEVPTGIRFTI